MLCAPTALYRVTGVHAESRFAHVRRDGSRGAGARDCSPAIERVRVIRVSGRIELTVPQGVNANFAVFYRSFRPSVSRYHLVDTR
jgi:hypothetical protein